MIGAMDRSILVVDDDPAFRELAERFLADVGLRVSAQAGTAEAGLAMAMELEPYAALVDIDLPDGDGITLAGTLVALPWRPRVVLTSVDPDAAAPEEVRRSGVRAFVSKDKLASGTLRSLLESD
jgi:DNA-binding NarL/FixJ family response regulator